MFTSIIKSVRDLIEDFYKTYGSGCFGLSNIVFSDYSGPMIICVSDNMPVVDVRRNIIAYYYALGTPFGSVASLTFIICGEKRMVFRMFLDPSYKPHIDFLENIGMRSIYPILFVKYGDDGINPVGSVFMSIDDEFKYFLNIFRALKDFDDRVGSRKSFDIAVRVINFVLDNLFEESMVKMCVERLQFSSH